MSLSSTVITIVFDNVRGALATPTLWGFAAHIALPNGQQLLFDTGSNGRVLLKNMAQLGCDPTALHWLFLSHQHWDHIGGLDSILEINPHIRCVVHSGFSQHLIADLRQLCQHCLVIDATPQQFAPRLWSTGQFTSEPPEHALLLELADSSVLISGCAHPGITAMITHAQQLLRKPVRTMIGGLHLGAADHATIATTVTELQRLGIQQLIPTHCTGDAAVSALHTAFGGQCYTGGIGFQLTV